MNVGMLGPLVAHGAGTSIVPTAAKPRQVLALLAFNANRMVTVHELMEELWGTNPPPSAPTTLQTYILQLRRKLRGTLPGRPGEANGILVTRHGGYVLEIDPASLDVLEFDRLVTSGYAAFEAGTMRHASELLGEALALWRGPVLADVVHGSRLAIEVVRLTEGRLGALERRMDADLLLGRHHELLGELIALAGRHPTHEDLHVRLMIAQYRSGCSAGALETYHRLRERLMNELGLEASGRMRRVQQAVMDRDPVLDLDAGSGRDGYLLTETRTVALSR
ncbi:BTAD domain-containing putative transcriptional regulator [Streptomyces scopuliridis]|uniref:AfsR/SARP family transcriptional regulator n=1 Tax=Streptomyces scopuliridis TaxID=452529 RepID=UPI0036A0FA55